MYFKLAFTMTFPAKSVCCNQRQVIYIVWCTTGEFFATNYGHEAQRLNQDAFLSVLLKIVMQGGSNMTATICV
jgi:hypothetical protein